MKNIFGFLFFFNLAITIASAQDVQETRNPAWNISNYISSHTQYNTSKSDKPVIDFEAIDKWIRVGPNEDLSLSPDGKFFAYSIQRSSQWFNVRDSLIVQAINGSWRKSFPGTSTPGFFTSDSKQYIFQLNDELSFTPLGGGSTNTSKGIVSYKTAPASNNKWLAYQLKDGEGNLVLLNTTTGEEKRFAGVSKYDFDNNGEWLVCQIKGESKEVVMYNLSNGKKLHFNGVIEYKLDETSKVIVLKTIEKTSDENAKSLKYIDLLNGKENVIWTTKDSSLDITNYSLDGSGKQVAFVIQNNTKVNSIWYYKAGMDVAIQKVSNQAKGIDEGLVIQGALRFTDNGNYILFYLQPVQDDHKTAPDQDAVQLDVWNYKDAILQSAQSRLEKEPRLYAAVIKTEADKVIRLENEYEILCERSISRKIPGDFVVVGKIVKQLAGDRFWEKNYDKDSYWLVSMLDGSRRLLSTKLEAGIRLDVILFSPDGKYLVYFDPDKDGNYFSYDLQTGRIFNISKGVPSSNLCFKDLFEVPESANIIRLNYGIAGWLNDDKGLLVYDAYDIWQLDLSGNKPAINLTNGRRQNTFFTLINHDRFSAEEIPKFNPAKDSLLLAAYNRNTKYSGFARTALGIPGNPELLFMGPYFFRRSPNLEGQFHLDEGMNPLKATGSNTWIVKRQTATDAPNYFVTNDFKTLNRLTDIQPQKSYNWFTAELHSFKQMDGTTSQGVLYKPENFDPSKKHPLIISFYFQKSDQLNQYPTPEYLTCPEIYSNPAWFVSHGYLVFIPDIYFNVEKGWGPSTVNTMDGAAKYLSMLPYVDGKRIGAAGHSNSGRFGYYLLTHSKSFAAMCIGAGTTDLIGTALATNYNIGPFPDASRLKWAEIDAPGTGLGELWKNKEKWMDHNAVLQADKVSSPLLLVHNKGDAVLFSQPVEFFTALRRLEKKAWWLQYDQGDHILSEDRDKKDLTVRYTQFFDHYLKGAPAPRWMTAGIPYKLKGIERRYELDPTGTCDLPDKKECPVCRAWNAQYKRTPQMFQKPISEWKLDGDLQKQIEREETTKYNEKMKGEKN
jgi:dipeptidyl aminopeptidase/acylaminoacyl peptidase